MRGILAVARKFFDLPEAAKLEVEMIHSPHFRGYTKTGRELTRGRPDWREQFDINSERVPLWRLGAPAWMRLQGPNQWPRSLPELRPALLGWQAAMTKVAVRLLRALAEALAQSPDFFEPIYRDAPNQHIKIIRYPGQEPETIGRRWMAAGREHTPTPEGGINAHRRDYRHESRSWFRIRQTICGRGCEKALSRSFVLLVNSAGYSQLEYLNINAVRRSSLTKSAQKSSILRQCDNAKRSKPGCLNFNALGRLLPS